MKRLIRKNNNNGFTLAELLIVVAIIAVLVAVSIPVFTAQLNKARYETEVANARAIYSELSADYLANGGKKQEDTIISPSTVPNVSLGSATTVTTKIGNANNSYKFFGLSEVKITLGTADAAPMVTVTPPNNAGYGEAQSFGTNAP